jgi:hypothetical protein
MHVQAPVNPANLEKQAEITLTTTGLNVTSDLTGAFCIVSNGAGAITGQYSF